MRVILFDTWLAAMTIVSLENRGNAFFEASYKLLQARLQVTIFLQLLLASKSLSSVLIWCPLDCSLLGPYTSHFPFKGKLEREFILVQAFTVA